jgi:hypothetical protein
LEMAYENAVQVPVAVETLEVRCTGFWLSWQQSRNYSILWAVWTKKHWSMKHIHKH